MTKYRDLISRTIFYKFSYIMGYIEPNNKVWRLTSEKNAKNRSNLIL